MSSLVDALYTLLLAENERAVHAQHRLMRTMCATHHRGQGGRMYLWPPLRASSMCC